jgi:hypothetical protein
VGVSKEASGGWTRSGAIAAQAARALAGVWKEVEVTVTTADSTWTTEISQPNLTIMTTRHYSRLAVRGERPRETLPQAASAEQLLAAWRPFHATGGTYVVSGPTEITETIIVSKSPNETAEGTVYTSTFELESDILYRTFTTPSGEFRVKYIRVEASAPLSCKLVGRWESVAASRGGLGIMFEFREDGTMLQSGGALVDFQIQSLANTELVLRENDGEGEALRLGFTIDEDTALVTPVGVEEPQRWSRIGSASPDQHPLVGIWSYVHYTGHTAYVTVTEEVMHLRVPVNPQNAVYQVTGDTMVVFQKGGEERWLLRSRNGQLFLTNPSGSEMELRRATAFF